MKNKVLKKFPFHPVLFAIYPILFLYTNNISMMEINYIYIPIVWSVIGTVLIWLILNFFIYNQFKSSAIISILLILFFSYGHLYRAIHYVPEKYIGINTDLFLSVSFMLLLIILSILILKHIKNILLFNRILNSIIIILLILPILTIGTSVLKDQNKLIERDISFFEIDSSSLNISNPDIYYIILDGYARGDVLKTIYEFDNSEFYQNLENRGFVILNKSLSNYAHTSLSLASSLNMNYIDSLIKVIDPLSEDRTPLNELISNNKVVKILREKKYKFITFSTGMSFTEIKDSDLYIKYKTHFNEFDNLLIDSTPLRLFRQVFSKPSPLFIHRENILFILNKLPAVKVEDSPKFIFAHIIAPHPPFVLGMEDDLETLNSRIYFGDGSMYHSMKYDLQFEYKEKYLKQLKALNTKVLEMLDGIFSKNNPRESVIILQADHGPRLLLNWEDPSETSLGETFPILNAYYLPKRIEVKPEKDFTPVNTFRFLFNQLFQTNFKLLTDKSYFSKWSHPYDFIEVEIKNVALKK